MPTHPKSQIALVYLITAVIIGCVLYAAWR
jgi:hypothetical protein